MAIDYRICQTFQRDNMYIGTAHATAWKHPFSKEPPRQSIPRLFQAFVNLLGCYLWWPWISRSKSLPAPIVPTTTSRATTNGSCIVPWCGNSPRFTMLTSVVLCGCAPNLSVMRLKAGVVNGNRRRVRPPEMSRAAVRALGTPARNRAHTLHTRPTESQAFMVDR